MGIVSETDHRHSSTRVRERHEDEPRIVIVPEVNPSGNVTARTFFRNLAEYNGYPTNGIGGFSYHFTVQPSGSFSMVEIIGSGRIDPAGPYSLPYDLDPNARVHSSEVHEVYTRARQVADLRIVTTVFTRFGNPPTTEVFHNGKLLKHERFGGGRGEYQAGVGKILSDFRVKILNGRIRNNV